MNVSELTALLDNSNVYWERTDMEVFTKYKNKVDSVFPVSDGTVSKSFVRYVFKTKRWIY